MNIALTARFSQLFDEEKSSYESILENVPTEIVIETICFINAYLERKPGKDSQAFLLASIYQLDKSKHRHLLSKLSVLEQELNRTIILFDVRFCLKFLHRELVSERKITKQIPLAEQYDRFFKACILVVEETTALDVFDTKNAEHNSSEQLKILKPLWSLAIKNVEFSAPVNVVYEGIKSMTFLDFLQKHEYLKPYLFEYLKVKGINSAAIHHGNLMNVVGLSFGENLKADKYVIELKISKNDSFFSDMILPEEEYNNLPGDVNFHNLKQFPLIRINERIYVPCWKFLYDSLFQRLVFAIYYSTSLQSKIKFEVYKSRVSKEYFEQYFFKRLMKSFFKDRHAELNFPDDPEFNPDCYYRKNNKIYLIEFKDNLINAATIHSNSLSVIQSYIDATLINGKGVDQIIRQLKNINRSTDLLQSKIDPSKLTVYPIIIYTNPVIGMPGVNEYVNYHFFERNCSLKHQFKNIKPITLIDIEFMFSNLHYFHKKKISLGKLIDIYHEKIKSNKKRANKNPIEPNITNSFPPFERVMLSKTNYRQFSDDKAYIDEVFSCFDLKGFGRL